MTTVIGVIVLVVLALVANVVWLVGIRFASEVSRATAPSGQTFDVVVHREGVWAYGKTAAVINLYGNLPVIWAVLRHPRGKPWRWDVDVYPRDPVRWPAVYREVTADRETARTRALELSQQIQDGELPWGRQGP